MTQTPKQWAATGFIFGIGSGLAAAVMLFVLIQPRAAAAPPNATTISGTIELDSSAASKVRMPAVVFVIARDEAKKGHPLMAKRLDVRRFPVAFSLGPQDAMMGPAASPRVFLEARIDTDGDAATKEPGAPSASIGAVAMWSTDIKLRLR